MTNTLQTGWTPGPWKINDHGKVYGEECIYIEAPTDGVATVFCRLGHDPRSLADAQLIATAPELYESLEDILRIAGVSINGQHYEEIIARIKKASLVLAKARGEK